MNRLTKSWLVATLAIVSLAAQAQTEAVNSNATQEPLVGVQVVEPAASSTSQQVLIQAIPVQQQSTAVKQPTTYVEASPLGESRAEQMRRMRQDVEVQTEQKIVEKLEQSRLEDEKRRMEKLFGNMNLSDQSQVVQQPVQVVPQVQPVPVVVQSVEAHEDKHEKHSDLKEMKAEIIGAIRESKAEVIEEAKPEKRSKSYFSGMMGAASYPGVSNMDGRWALGFALGSQLEDSHVMIEGQFMYSNYYLDQAYFEVPGFRDSLYRELDQFNFGVNAKVGFLESKIQPYVGAGVSYVYRRYKDLAYVQTNPYGSVIYPTVRHSESISSNAVDMAAIGGLNFKVSKHLSLGLEYRYSFNLLTWANSEFDQVVQNYRRDGRDLVEETSYQTFGVNATYQF